MMMTMMQWLKPGAWAITRVLLALCATSALAGPVADRVQSQSVVRVCVWPDYYGVTYRHPRTQQLAGIDIDLSAELARDLKAKVVVPLLGVKAREYDVSAPTHPTTR